MRIIISLPDIRASAWKTCLMFTHFHKICEMNETFSKAQIVFSRYTAFVFNQVRKQTRFFFFCLTASCSNDKLRYISDVYWSDDHCLIFSIISRKLLPPLSSSTINFLKTVLQNLNFETVLHSNWKSTCLHQMVVL